MGARRTGLGAGHGFRSWPALALTVLAVAAPTACIVFFLNAAVRNERLAVRQKLVDAYRLRADEAQNALGACWKRALQEIEAGIRDLAPPEAFARAAQSGLADGIIIMRADGKPSYPSLDTETAAPDEGDPEWIEAVEAEYRGPNPAEAAGKFEAIARGANDAGLYVRASIARARCLAKAGDPAGARGALSAVIGGGAPNTDFEGVRDEGGNLAVPSAMLFFLELVPERRGPEFTGMAQRLAARLEDYSGRTMACAQRRFLIRSLREIAPDAVKSTLEGKLHAEDLAAEYLDSAHLPPQPLRLTEAKPGLYGLASSDRQVIALFIGDSIESRAGRWLEAYGFNANSDGASVALTAPAAARLEGALITVPASDWMPGWTLEVRLAGPDPFSQAARKQVAAYFWTGVLGIFTVAALAVLAGGYVSRQMRLTQLKNDLIATISHELKTPLASMRVLVDTLVEGRVTSDEQAKEYFRLISKENERLTHLVDNFLTFSRMERNKRAFEFSRTNVAEAVRAAVDLVRDRCSGPASRLEMSVAENIPPVTADRDAIVTVLVNLLDNALKYTGEKKEITVRAHADRDWVSLEVSDNGAGISRRERKRIFDRFYQVDQSLSRATGGCGLGLSIVRFIVDAHNGVIEVDSEVGKGTTFRVKLPLGAQGETELKA